MSGQSEHVVEIRGTETIAVDDGRLVYRPRCSCGWIGWAVFERDNARRQRDRHLSEPDAGTRVLRRPGRGER